jgi:hypothetical protein
MHIIEIGQMTYNVYQRWDPLKVCILGRSYSPEFFKFIKNTKVRSMLELIAEETEEDYQILAKCLANFGVKVLRPELSDNWQEYTSAKTGKILRPPTCPRDYTIAMDDGIYFLNSEERSGTKNVNDFTAIINSWDIIKSNNWPTDITIDQLSALPENIKQEIFNLTGVRITGPAGEYHITDMNKKIWGSTFDDILTNGNKIFTDVPWYLCNFNTATMFQIGKDIYVGNEYHNHDTTRQMEKIREHYPDYRWHAINTAGHADGTYSPVKPGLIISSYDIPGSDYTKLFPDWEIVYVPNENKLGLIDPFVKLKQKNGGKWWVPNQPIDDDFVDFVEEYLNHWVGYVEETIFDVNMLVIDEKNVICESYNKIIFDAFERHGITPHIVQFRHSHFWDAGIHCITSDISRTGVLTDYFPNRN